mgnify:CR=1 FL=1
MKPRAHEPWFWLLFGAGGVIAALALPALVLVTGLLGPAGLLGPEALSHERVHAFAGSWPGRLALFVLIVLPMWLAAHRIQHTLADLRLGFGRGPNAVLCYGLAAMGSLLTVVALLRIA